jgi:hypothetical protein
MSNKNTESLDSLKSYSTSDGCCDTNKDNLDEGECPGGVCPMPIKKPVMKPPEIIDQEVPKLDKLFSQLFGTLPGYNGQSNPIDVFESMIKGGINSVNEGEEDEGDYSDEDEGDYSDEDEGDYSDEADEEDEEDENSEDSEDSDDEDYSGGHSVYNLDKSWDTIKQLLESHINITRAVVDLIKKV